MRTKRVLGHLFRTMEEGDWSTFAGADEGTLICRGVDADDGELVLLLCPDGDIVAVSEDGKEVTWRALA